MNAPRRVGSSRSADSEAAVWFARQRVGALTDGEAHTFRDWLTRSADNLRAWNSHQQLWTGLEAAGDDPAVLAMREAAREYLLRGRSRRHWMVGGSLLAAAAVSALLLWRPPAPAVILAPSSSPLISTAARDVRSLPQVSDVSTRVGERALMRLADGSTVTLNSDSAVHVDYTDRERSVHLLRGEAYFEVARNKSRPFVVTAGSRQVIAVGTAFNVRLEPRKLKVDLVEGRVRVQRLSDITRSGQDSPSPHEVTLEAGSTLVAGADQEYRIEPLDHDHEVAWRTGKLVFDGTRLADVVAEMNRYSTQQLQLQDAALGERELSGVFEAAGGEAFARALENYGMARIASRSDDTVVLAPSAVRARGRR